MPGLPSVSVIVCAHSTKRLEMLVAALDSVTRQSTPAFEIIAVIDHNPELQSLISTRIAGIRTMANTGMRGLSGARNVGVAEARGEIVAFLDDDAVAASDWLERLSAPYLDPYVMGVGGHVAPVWPGERPKWLPEEFYWVIGCSYRGLPVDVAAVRNVIGCNMSFRSSVFDCIGQFSDRLGRDGDNAAGCEETEFCIRAGRAFPHSRILYDPKAQVSHYIAAERLTWHYFRTRCRAEGASKALVVAGSGRRRGLSSERAYVRRTLPAGFLGGLTDGLLRLDTSGLQRAATIVAGLGYATSSYLAARLHKAKAGSREPETFLPIRIADIDLARPPRPLAAERTDAGLPYGGAFCLVREKGRPIGVVEFPLYGSDMAAPRLNSILANARANSVPAPRTASMAEPPFARVVIATRDRPVSLSQCLDSLLRQDYARYEIVVVDNAPSSSETADLIAGRYVSSGRIRYRRENRPGLGNAHNCGIADASSAIVAFTDDDVLVDPQWLSALSSNFTGADQVGCVTGLILPVELETRAQYWTELHGGFGKGFERRVFDLAGNRPSGALFPFAAGSLGSGANMAFRTAVLRDIGGFDGALGAGTIARGGDDLAAFVSVIRAGFQLVYEPEAIVWHRHRRGEAGMRNQAYGYGVGLGAYLTKFAVEDPSALLHYIRALPAAAVHIFSPASGKNSRLPDDYPTTLKWRERLGIVAGVPAYLRSRAALRAHQRAAGARAEHWSRSSEPLGK